MDLETVKLIDGLIAIAQLPLLMVYFLLTDRIQILVFRFILFLSSMGLMMTSAMLHSSGWFIWFTLFTVFWLIMFLAKYNKWGEDAN